MTKRLLESGTLMEAGTSPNVRKAVLITQGIGSSGYYPPEFFTQENADALAQSLSFPGHPEWGDPTTRDPLSAIGWVGDTVSIESDDIGAKRFVAEYHIGKSRPDVLAYLDEFGTRLGLSIFIEGEGEYDSNTNIFTVTTLNGADPYKSVDLVVAAGRGGTLVEGAKPGSKNPLAEAQRKLLALAEAHASAPAEEENEEHNMDLEKKVDSLIESVATLTSTVSALVTAKEDSAQAEAQAKVDTEAVQTAVESRLEQFAADSALINEAGLTESQQAEAMVLAKTGGDVKTYVESAKKVFDEARAMVEGNKNNGGRTAHTAGSISESAAPVGSRLPSFGKVR